MNVDHPASSGPPEPAASVIIRHGTTRAYRAGCKCPACRAANAAAWRKGFESRQARLATADFEHGASAYSNWRCRCEICCKGHSARMAASQERRTEARLAEAAVR